MDREISMKTVMAIKIFGALTIMVLLSGFGSSVSNAGTPEDAKVAYRLMQTGKVNELRAMLAKDRSIANTLYKGRESLLNIVIDTRPAFPNMVAIIKVLLEAGADPNMHAPQLLRKAIWRRDPEVFKLLLDHGANPRIVWKKKNINMLQYSKRYGDKRFDAITDAWEKTH